MFSVSLIIVAALVIIKGSGYVHCYPGVPFQLPNQQQDHLRTSVYHEQTVNVDHSIYRQSVPTKEFSQNNIHNDNAHTQYNNLNVAGSPQPIVTKHIYFHVAPPDPEEMRPIAINYNRKKIYNIVFIKTPSQQPKNQAILQNLIRNQYGASAEKTLIYVLVKSPEDQQSLNKTPSPNHEVFYVKYKGNPERSAIAQYNNSLPRTDIVQSLLPGLVNG